MQVKLDLSTDEVNQILGALSEQPFIKVAALIGKIKQQGDAQLSAPDLKPDTED